MNPDTTLSLVPAAACLPGEAERFEIRPPEDYALPYTRVDAHDDAVGNVVFLAVFLLVFAWVRLYGKDLLPTLLQVLFKRKRAAAILNEGGYLLTLYHFLCLGLSFSVLAVFLDYFCTGEFIGSFSLYAFAGLLAYHFFMAGLLRFLGWIFNAKGIAAEAVIHLWTFHICAGLLASPFVLVLLFAREYAAGLLVRVVLVIIGCIFVGKILRAVAILFSNKVSILYMILYLCALEMIPMLVLYRTMG